MGVTDPHEHHWLDDIYPVAGRWRGECGCGWPLRGIEQHDVYRAFAEHLDEVDERDR